MATGSTAIEIDLEEAAEDPAVFAGMRGMACPPDVRDFCAREGIEPELRTAVELVGRCFDASQCAFALVEDPDSGGQWVAIEIAVAGTPERFAQAYRDYIREWVSRSPAAMRRKIRLSYSIG